MSVADRLTLTQEQLTALTQRRHLDAKFEAFMVESIKDRQDIRKELSRNTQMLNAVHTALFAKDDDNELGIPGLVVSMQRVVQHVTVTCNIARFFKWCAVGLLSAASALFPVGRAIGWW